MVLIYRKSLKLSYVKGGVGDIVNLISIECNRVAEACVHLHYLWSAAFECLVLLIWSYLDIGMAALAPFAVVFFVLFPLQFLFAIKASAAACRMTEQITKRVHLMSEVLTAIKLIKFYTWENYYRKKIKEMRKLEMNEMKTELVYKIASFAVVFTTPAVSICLAVYMYKLAGNELTARSIFGFLFLLNSLRYPLYFLPNSERNINGAQTSVLRLQDFLTLPEIDTVPENSTLMAEDVFMEIKDADFIWDGDLDHPHVTDLNLSLKKGQLIAIVGDLGSGKSLLAAIMGQLKRVKGEVITNGCTFGFIPQEPWFINASVRDNIVFGLELNESRYSDAIRLSGLTRDLMMLSNKDESFVNELNLSPNQKQRLALARVIYQNPDIVLMEDCLGDFNQEQSKQIFKECLRNQLSKTKCILMLTQQKQFLSSCDSIIVIKGGKVVEHGPYKELKEKNVNFSAWVTDVVHIEDDPNGLIENVSEIRLDPATSTTRPTIANPLRPPAGNFAHLAIRKRSIQPRSSPLAASDPIVAQENTTIRQIMELNSNSMQTTQLNEHTISKMIERNQNSVLTGNAMRPPANFANQDVVTRTIDTNNLTVHSLHDFDVGTMEPGTSRDDSPYIQFLRTQPGLVTGLAFLVIFITAHGFRFVCDVWLTFLVDQKGAGDFERNMIILASLSGVIAISILLRGYGYLHIIISKGSSWHNKILEAVLRAPMSFYDITPLGHILSFFAKHLFSIDEVLPDTALQVLSFLPLVIGTIVLACVYVPWLWTTLPVYFFFWWLAITICHDSQDMFQQLESSNKSPMFAHLSNTLEGLFMIRLYRAEDRFDHFNRTLIDADHKALFSLLIVKAFMSACLDTVTSVLIYITALFCVLFPINPSQTGVALTNILQLLLFVPWLVKMIYILNGAMNSVSSLVYFGDNVPRETRSKSYFTPEESWPVHGEIEFKRVTSKYHRYGVSVLKDVSFHISPKEKIAIVGRSGSGKSTILMSLLRILEPSEGNIMIDGVDTNSISLRKLRSRIAVIPQEPVMLTGTIRTNLDPDGQSTDDDIWKALKAVHLGEKINEMPGKLETPITENGRMFNISERQLFCIARAILIQTTIVVYDEPAVTVDRDTEYLIQQVMNENFKDCTVIFLATRFRVIVQMDRVMVMKHGGIVEFDTPLNLLDDPKSKFSMMLSQTGDLDPNYLRQLALKKAGVGESKGSVNSLGSQRSLRQSMPRRLGELFAPPPKSNKSDDDLSMKSENSSDRQSIRASAEEQSQKPSNSDINVLNPNQ